MNPFTDYLLTQVAPNPIPPKPPRFRNPQLVMKIELYGKAMEGKGWMRGKEIGLLVGKAAAQVNTYMQEVLWPNSIVRKRKTQGVRQRLVPNEWFWVGMDGTPTDVEGEEYD